MSTIPAKNNVMDKLRQQWLAGFTPHEACGRKMDDKYTPLLKYVCALFSKWDKEAAVQKMEIV